MRKLLPRICVSCGQLMLVASADPNMEIHPQCLDEITFEDILEDMEVREAMLDADNDSDEQSPPFDFDPETTNNN